MSPFEELLNRVYSAPGDFWPVADEYVNEHYEVAS